MPYTVQQLATLAGVSVRTLHYYNEIGLLKPASVGANGYRRYEEKELLTLQQILFFRELEFPLEEIAGIITSPDFDMTEALGDQRHLIELKKKRLNGLIRTIDKTINKINKKTIMNDNELYGDFNKKEMEAYAQEAKKRWGHTDAYKQSQERVKKMTPADFARIKKAGNELNAAMADLMKSGKNAQSTEVQRLIALHYAGLRNFYEPNFQLYRGLADMYAADARFAANFEKHSAGLAAFMKEAMIYYADENETK